MAVEAGRTEGASPFAPLPLLVSFTATLLLLPLVARLGWLRLTGNLPGPFLVPQLASCGLIVASATGLLQLLAGLGAAGHRNGPALLACFWPVQGALVLLLALTVSLPGSSTLGLLLLWVPILAQQCIGGLLLQRSWAKLGHFHAAAVRESIAAARPSADHAPPATAPMAAEDGDGLGQPMSESLPAAVCQQMQRLQLPDGREQLAGKLRAHFDRGQHQQYVHVVFCPALPAVPALAAHQLDGPPARIRPTQVEAFGARLQVRLAAPADQAADVVIQYSAVCPPITAADAAEPAAAGSSQS